MILEAPLTLLKTRMEVISPNTLWQEYRLLADAPFAQAQKGLGLTLAREGLYSLLHYNSYRFLKDDVLLDKLGIDSAFIPAFGAGVVALTLSQPIEVMRSVVSISKAN